MCNKCDVGVSPCSWQNKSVKSASINIKTPEGVCDAFVAYPSDNGKFSAVILLMDAFGLRSYLMEMGEQLAALGYFVLVPNLFYRIKKAPLLDQKFPLDKAQMEEGLKTLRPLIASYTPEHCLADAQYFLNYLFQQKQVRSGKIGLAGYCMGGSLAIRIAARYPEKIAAVASFHAGRLATDAPDSPHLLLPKIQAELFVAHADNDNSMPPEQIEKFNRALAKSSIHYETDVYKGAAHGFTMKDLPVYNEAALKKHWKKLAELFSRHL